MQRITLLKDIGIGKKCLIVGGGTSVNDFEFDKLSDIVTIIVNDNIPDYRMDYLIYNDNGAIQAIRNALKEGKIPETTKIICFSKNHFPRANYYYNESDLQEIQEQHNTGLKAIYIAKNIMKFDEIYLIGFDYHTKIINGEEVSHFRGDDVGVGRKYPEKQQLINHIKHLTNMVKQFDILENISNIYNCYMNSKLKLFEYKLPY